MSNFSPPIFVTVGIIVRFTPAPDSSKMWGWTICRADPPGFKDPLKTKVIKIPHKMIKIPHKIIKIPCKVIKIPHKIIKIPHMIIKTPCNIIKIWSGILKIPSISTSCVRHGCQFQLSHIGKARRQVSHQLEWEPVKATFTQKNSGQPKLKMSY